MIVFVLRLMVFWMVESNGFLIFKWFFFWERRIWSFCDVSVWFDM